MLVLAFVALACMLMIIGAGATLALLALAAIGTLVGLSIVSSSVIIGLARRSLSSAVRAMILQCGILLGAIAGIAVVAITTGLINAAVPWYLIVLVGSIAGGLAGLALGLLINAAISTFLRLLLQSDPSRPTGGFEVKTRSNP